MFNKDLEQLQTPKPTKITSDQFSGSSLIGRQMDASADLNFDLSATPINQASPAPLSVMSGQEQRFNNVQRAQACNEVKMKLESLATIYDFGKESQRLKACDELHKWARSEPLWAATVHDDQITDIIYDASNTMARDANIVGNIEESLKFMMVAVHFVKEWVNIPKKYEGGMKVTVISELYLNIANAQLYLEMPKDAIASAQQAVFVAKKFIDKANKKLESLSANDEYQSVYSLMQSQKQIVVNSYLTMANSLDQSDAPASQVQEKFDAAQQSALQYFGPRSDLYQDMYQRCQDYKHLKSVGVRSELELSADTFLSKADTLLSKAHPTISSKQKTTQSAKTLKNQKVEDFEEIAHKSVITADQSKVQIEKKGRKLKPMTKKYKEDRPSSSKKMKLKGPESFQKMVKKMKPESPSSFFEKASAVKPYKRPRHQIADSCVNKATWHNYNHAKTDLIAPRDFYGNYAWVNEHKGGPPPPRNIRFSYTHLPHRGIVTPMRTRSKRRNITKIIIEGNGPATQPKPVTPGIPVVRHEYSSSSSSSDIPDFDIEDNDYLKWEKHMKEIDEEYKHKRERMAQQFSQEIEIIQDEYQKDIEEEQRLMRVVIDGYGQGSDSEEIIGSHCPCDNWRCEKCNPPPQTDADYGPPVYDPYFKCWTFPYAKVEEPTQPEAPKPKKLTAEIGFQVTPKLPPPPETSEKGVQPVKDMQNQTRADNQTQTERQFNRFSQTIKREVIVDREAALWIIIRFLRKVVRKKRIERYKMIRGVLYSKKFWINPNSCNLEIFTMHMVYEFISEKCLYLVFTIFDYVTCNMLQVHYDALEYVREFNVYDLQRLCRPSLQLLSFERSPFMMHIACLQSIIIKNRISLEQLSDFEVEDAKSTSSGSIDIRPSTPPPIYREPVGPDVSTQGTGMRTVKIVDDEQPLPAPKPKPTSAVETIQLWWKLWMLTRYKLLYRGYRFVQQKNCACGGRWFMVTFWQIKHGHDDGYMYRLVAKEQRDGDFIASAQILHDEKQDGKLSPQTPQIRQYGRVYRAIKGKKHTQVAHVCPLADAKQRNQSWPVINKVIDDEVVPIEPYRYYHLLEGYKNYNIGNEPVLRLPGKWVHDQISKQYHFCEDMRRLEYYLEGAICIELSHTPTSDRENLRSNQLEHQDSIVSDIEAISDYADEDKNKLTSCHIHVVKLYRLKMGQPKDIYHEVKLSDLGTIPQTISLGPLSIQNEQKIQRKGEDIGCRRIYEFEHMGCTCRLYRRVRWYNSESKKRKYKDYKIKAIKQGKEMSKSMDYVVFFKLPRKLEEMVEFIKKTLKIVFEDHIEERPIRWLEWTPFQGKTVYSQMYWDYETQYKRFDRIIDHEIYMTQNPHNTESQRASREPRLAYIDGERANWPRKPDPFYYIFVQQIRPKNTDYEEIRKRCRIYETPDSETYRIAKNKHKQNCIFPDKDNPDAEYSSTDSEDEDRFNQYKKFAWDLDVLKNTQLDDFTVFRQYRRLTCQQSDNMDYQDHFYWDMKVGEWPKSGSLVFPYIMNELSIHQENVKDSDEYSINIKMKLAYFDLKYTNAYEYLEGYYKRKKIEKQPEVFMCQDVARAANQNFAVTVYQNEEKKIFTVEAVRVGQPAHRAYKVLKYQDLIYKERFARRSLAQDVELDQERQAPSFIDDVEDKNSQMVILKKLLRGQRLEMYIDEHLEQFGNDLEAVSQAGHEFTIQSIDFNVNVQEFIDSEKGKGRKSQLPGDCDEYMEVKKGILRKLAMVLLRNRVRRTAGFIEKEKVGEFKLEDRLALIRVILKVDVATKSRYWAIINNNYTNGVDVQILELDGLFPLSHTSPEKDIKDFFQDCLEITWDPEKLENGDYVLQSANKTKNIPMGVSINEDMLKKFENKLNLEDQLEQFNSWQHQQVDEQLEEERKKQEVRTKNRLDVKKNKSVAGEVIDADIIAMERAAKREKNYKELADRRNIVLQEKLEIEVESKINIFIEQQIKRLTSKLITEDNVQWRTEIKNLQQKLKGRVETAQQIRVLDEELKILFKDREKLRSEAFKQDFQLGKHEQQASKERFFSTKLKRNLQKQIAEALRKQDVEGFESELVEQQDKLRDHLNEEEKKDQDLAQKQNDHSEAHTAISNDLSVITEQISKKEAIKEELYKRFKTDLAYSDEYVQKEQIFQDLQYEASEEKRVKNAQVSLSKKLRPYERSLNIQTTNSLAFKKQIRLNQEKILAKQESDILQQIEFMKRMFEEEQNKLIEKEKGFQTDMNEAKDGIKPEDAEDGQIMEDLKNEFDNQTNIRLTKFRKARYQQELKFEQDIWQLQDKLLDIQQEMIKVKEQIIELLSNMIKTVIEQQAITSKTADCEAILQGQIENQIIFQEEMEHQLNLYNQLVQRIQTQINYIKKSEHLSKDGASKKLKVNKRQEVAKLLEKIKQDMSRFSEYSKDQEGVLIQNIIDLDQDANTHRYLKMQSVKAGMSYSLAQWFVAKVDEYQQGKPSLKKQATNQDVDALAESYDDILKQSLQEEGVNAQFAIGQDDFTAPEQKYRETEIIQEGPMMMDKIQNGIQNLNQTLSLKGQGTRSQQEFIRKLNSIPILSELSLYDIFAGLNGQFVRTKVNPEDIYEIFKSKTDRLLELSSIKKLANNFLGLKELDDDHIKSLSQELASTGLRRSALTTKEFINLLQAPSAVDEQQANDDWNVFKQMVDIKFSQDWLFTFLQSVEEARLQVLEEDNGVFSSLFMKLLFKWVGIDSKNALNLVMWLDSSKLGKVKISDLIKRYNDVAQPQAKEEEPQVYEASNSSFADIILAFETDNEEKEQSLRQVLKSNDKDKNYLISAKELVNALNKSKVFEVKFDSKEEFVISQAFLRKFRRSEANVKEIQNMIESSKLIKYDYTQAANFFKLLPDDLFESLYERITRADLIEMITENVKDSIDDISTQSQNLAGILDANKDGFIDEEDINQMISQIEKDKQLESIIDEIWYTYDTDRQGTLDFNEVNEFLQGFVKKVKGVDQRYQITEEYLLRSFQELDTDKSGDISREEMRPFIIKLIQQNAHQNTEQEQKKAMIESAIGAIIEGIWSKFDTNYSGVLSIEEASNLIREFVGKVEMNESKVFKAFNQLDTNQSGTIDKQEMRVFLSEQYENMLREGIE